MKKLKLADPGVECRGCEKGIAMCRGRPCWPLPSEVRALVAAGHAGSLMLDYWARDGGRTDVLVVCPANPGYGGKRSASIDPGALLAKYGPLAPVFAALEQLEVMDALKSGCSLLSPEGLCQLHDAGLKPIEGRLSCCKSGDQGWIRKRLVPLWDTDEGRAAASEWAAAVGLALA